MSNRTVIPFPESSKEQTIGDYRLVMSRVDHMIPHVPTLEMAKLHPWHVYKGDILCYTAPKEECLQWISRVSQKSETQSRGDLPTSSALAEEKPKKFAYDTKACVFVHAETIGGKDDGNLMCIILEDRATFDMIKLPEGGNEKLRHKALSAGNQYIVFQFWLQKP